MVGIAIIRRGICEQINEICQKNGNFDLANYMLLVCMPDSIQMRLPLSLGVEGASCDMRSDHKQLASLSCYAAVMNAATPLSLPQAEAWPSLWNQANGWRGRAMEEFARAEMAVSEALIQLAAVPGRGEGITLPHLAGQRFSVLAKQVAEGGPHAAQGKGVAQALSEWRDHEALRALLCHGVATITVDHRGRWHLILRLVAFRAGKPVRDMLVLDEEEAAARLQVLHAARQRLEGRLRAMLVKFKQG